MLGILHALVGSERRLDRTIRVIQKALGGIGDAALMAIGVAAPLAGGLLMTAVFMTLFDLPWEESYSTPLNPMFLLSSIPALGVGGLFVLASRSGRREVPLAVRVICVFAVTLVPFFASIGSGDPEGALAVVLVMWPFTIAALPALFPSYRASWVKLAIGVAISAWVVFLVTGIAYTFPHFIEFTADPYYVATGVDDEGVNQMEWRDGSALYDATISISYLAGMILGLLWSIYAAVAYLSDGLAARKLPSLPPADERTSVLLDDFYVRGLVAKRERDEFANRHARLKNEWSSLARTITQHSARRRHGRLLTTVGALGVVLATIAVAVSMALLTACVGDSTCSGQAAARTDDIGIIPTVGGFALGLGVAALCSGALALRGVRDGEDLTEQRLAVIVQRAEKTKDELLDLARARTQAEMKL